VGLQIDTARPGMLIRGDSWDGGAEGDHRKIRLLAVVSGPRHQLNDFGAHEHPSHTAMAINPTSASDIR